MAELVIRGHATRGKEVIKLLEMLGANRLGYKDTFVGFYYYIECGAICSSDEYPTYATIFTLEEFEEKYPYKVGDKVISLYGKLGRIRSLIWSERDNQVRYELEADVDSLYFANELQPFKEETIEEKKINQMSLANCDLDEVEIVLGDKFEMEIKDGKYYAVKKKPQYPTTYGECCDILGYDPCEDEINCYKGGFIESFVRLLICRDAYWKIAGEQMGLGKPWEPDFTNNDEERYGIYTLANKVERDFCGVGDVNMILSFPTEEMRDAFFENFKDLIEQCKELL